MLSLKSKALYLTWISPTRWFDRRYLAIIHSIYFGIFETALAFKEVVGKSGLPWPAFQDERLHQGAFGLNGVI